MHLRADLAVIGSGFGGSLTALLASRAGLRVLLLESGTHPRFAIGESSTPLADLALREIAARYELPRLAPLSSYGAWKRTYPEVMRGLKRGFSYFHHVAGEPFRARDDHRNELLVEANPDEENADTHWLRADVDAFLVGDACTQGVEYLDRIGIEGIDAGEGTHLRTRRGDRPLTIEAEFVVDASGGAAALAEPFSIPDATGELFTCSRAVYSHFTDVRRWRTIYEEAGGRSADHPFDCDAAALHHVFDGGWMWVLRFDDDVVSAGFALDVARHPLDASISAEEEWRLWLARFPSIGAQFERARPLRPLCRTGRLQRLVGRAAGARWAMLPSAAGFIDPLHSSGIAHTLSGIERLVPRIASGSDRSEELAQYESSVRRELRLVDRLVHGCYETFGRFELMASFAMCYFAGAIEAEHRRREGRQVEGDSFLLASDPAFHSIVEHGHRAALELAQSPRLVERAIARYGADVAASLAGMNRAGLGDPEKRNMYAFT